MFNDIINNIALIVALSLLYSLLSRKLKGWPAIHKAATGILFGAIAIVGMMNPVAYAPGIIFDGRSIITSTAGFITGPLAACIAALLSTAYRYNLGGGGAVMGVSVIAASATIGSAYYYLRRRNNADIYCACPVNISTGCPVNLALPAHASPPLLSLPFRTQ